ncbi:MULTISPECIES: FAD:protein FMN transferase [Asticcacaulis]|uniref:FAD:protein FMN transferase n=1 Tax=Asticcacaulis TaxID=76890 RepID=UPI001AE318E9|nr:MULTISPECIES: FAD:protein FMN transferase [Asticcacaulis]MBP2159212.1 thiamine biosynthesis lipoprotein [Asticcacaulis solisilvae]MDR6800257.1 thiamine biosynthesis lipoprotein [Asticcacaulis sp. BE141]
MTGPSGAYDTRVVIPDLAALPRPDAEARKLVLEGEAFATDWRIAVYVTAERLAGLEQTLRPRVQAWLDLIDRQMSPYKPQSDLCRFNAAGPNSFVPLPQVMLQVVRHALDIARLTDGAFDPSLLSAVEMWGFGAKVVTDDVPAEAEIRRVRDCAHDWRDLVWQANGMVRPDGVRLDLCAIAKGYAVDGLAQMLSLEPGISAGLVEIGGELKGFGVQPDGLPWWVEVESAEGVTATQRTVIALCDHAVATSGDLRRGFEHDGVRLSHTIDARTACPVRPEVASATVIDRDAWRADALATALIVMGEARALAFARQEGIACLLRVRDNGTMRDAMSPALEAWL